MTPSNAILDAIANLFANDPATIAPVALAVHVHLAKAAFTPTPSLDIASLVEASFDGGSPLSAGVGPQQEFLDPASGQRIVQLLEPSGGWHWVTTGITDLPQTIFGWYATDNTDAVLYGSGLLAIPVVLNAIGQGIDIPQIRYTFLNGSPF